MSQPLVLPNIYTQVGNTTPIGNSTIDKIGCLTVDAAMVAGFFGHSINPSALAYSVKYSGNLWIWSELTRLFPDIKYIKPVQAVDIIGGLTDSQMNEIRGGIDSGCPVFIKIVTPTIPEHWLLGVGYNGDDILVANPLHTNLKTHYITDYGIPPKQIIRAYGWYAKVLPPATPQKPTYEQLEQKIEDMKQTEIRLRAEKDKALADKDVECQQKFTNFKQKILDFVAKA